MNRGEVFRLLKDKLPGYLDYIGVPVRSNDEKLTPVLETERLRVRQIDPAMPPQMYLRSSVLDKLLRAADRLADYHPTLGLEIVSGYRSLTIQTQLFEKYKAKLQGQYTGVELLKEVHQYIAVPEVAGHPTGGAVDVQILRGGEAVDFGTKIWEFTDDSLTFSPFITKDAWDNRQLLRRIMMGVGFAPFDGEWWHFSYGDKEWAKYYGMHSAIYEQIEFS